MATHTKQFSHTIASYPGSRWAGERERACYPLFAHALKVTINCAEGCLHSEFIALVFRKPSQIFTLKQVTVQQHMNEMFYSERIKLLFKNAPTHSNQQLAAPLERFCAKLLVDCKKFDPEFFSCTTSRYLLGRHLKIPGALCILLVIFVGI